VRNKKLLLVLLMSNGLVNAQFLQVQVNAYVPVSLGTLRETVSQAERLFRKAGVESKWTVCSGTNAPCGGGDLVINIIAQPTLGAPGSDRALATTNLTTHTAYIFFNRVGRSVLAQGHSLPVLLSSVMAHEAGHVLGLQHSTGIMHKEFVPADVEAANVGRLGFERSQAAQLRTAVRSQLATVTDVYSRGGLAAFNVGAARRSESH
jgi:hypothetical protein